MAELQSLIDMGFAKEKAEKALAISNNNLEQAMEWILAHADETPTNEQPPPSSKTEEEKSEESKDPAEAKSIRCDDCGKLFKSAEEVEYHAAKTNHSNYSESTEEKKPLTEEEKKAQLALLEEKMKRKRLEREENEKKEALERERLRIKSGKDMTEAKKKLEEQEMKKILDERKREKQEEKMARDRVRAQIEADKAARRLRSGEPIAPVQSPPPVTLPPQNVISPAAKNYTQTKIQIKMLDGASVSESFGVKEQLAAVRVFVQMKMPNVTSFGLMTSFPRKVFIDSDYTLPLQELNLVPSAVLIVTKPQQ